MSGIAGSHSDACCDVHNPRVQSETLARRLQDFISESRDAVVIEDGAVTFDLERAKYSISSEHGKCLLHFWSDERNAVRRVTEAELKNGVLRLAVLRFGQTRPSKIEICRERDRRTPSARKASRAAYQQRLRRVLERNFPGFVLTGLTSAMDLERSFGPVYVRGLLRKGRSAFAVLGVNGQEMQGSIDACLTFAVLWLNACRESQAGFQVEGESGTFSNTQEIVFGVGPQEVRLTNENEQEFANLLRGLIESRQPKGPRNHPLWRVHPERWLEALVLEDVSAIDGNLEPTQVYSQVPAFAAADRAMVDVLSVTVQANLPLLN